MMKLISAFVTGAIFSIGLTISGMTNPEHVLSFLDVFGAWSPRLMVVLAVAVVVTGIGYRLVWKQDKPLFDYQFAVPTSRLLDGRLMTGAAIFGVGWGLVGLCPGPALAAVTMGDSSVLVFIVAMLAGMLIQRVLSVFLDSQTQSALSV